MKNWMRNTLALIIILITNNTYAQSNVLENFYTSGKINVVIAVILIILLGLIIYLFKIDRSIKKLEDKIKE